MISNSDIRILLWDIDGTLLKASRKEVFKEYMAPVLSKVFGTTGCIAEMRVSGMTDLQIIGEALKEEGFTHEQIRERLEDIRECHMIEMERVANSCQDLFYLLPGVAEVLTVTHNHPRYLSALLTGNIESAAHLKMRLVGLQQFFTLPGAFGDDSHDRRDLPALAAERIQSRTGMTFRPDQFIVIGDTPNDISCAKHFGAKSLAVGTGSLYKEADLIALNPDAFIKDFSEPEKVIELLESL
jgi:phosphoglycolate phosphatase